MITHTFDYAGGTVDVEISDSLKHQRVTFTKNREEICISDAAGELYDWSSVYTGISGAALQAEEWKAAKTIGIEAVGDYITAIAGE